MCSFTRTHIILAQVNKDGSGYPPNSVIIGMFEGYYSHPGVGGVRVLLHWCVQYTQPCLPYLA